MLDRNVPALILAPMDGITDAPMRALQGETGAFTFAVSEFLRVSIEVPPRRVFLRHIPELPHGARTPSGLPVQVQLLGGDAGRMAAAAVVATEAGATAIDINFGCPAPTVNRHDGGATLLKHPVRIREIVSAVRAAVPREIAVSAKLRLGWDSIDDIHVNAEMAAEGGADWLTIHARTRTQGYKPPVYWQPIGVVRERLGLPVVANGDIWTLDDFRQCREETGCIHFMVGRSALANPLLASQIGAELGIGSGRSLPPIETLSDWIPHLERLVHWTDFYVDDARRGTLLRLKQWLRLASNHGNFTAFDLIKRTQSLEELFASLADCHEQFSRP
ncbi:MAG: dusC 2 [Chthonomonadaceae bacterium]|nr:dusC 2 [Chthonomonadaceae bacterium]